MQCIVCGKELTGKQKKYCCTKCKNQSINSKRELPKGKPYRHLSNS